MSVEIDLDVDGHGSLRGTLSLGVAHRFLNVPYALPPTGTRRWRKPIPLPDDYSYGSPRDCTKFGNICFQPPYMVNGNNLSVVPGSPFSEDCLVVNIWTPAKPRPSPAGGTGQPKWPVLVWIHGGWLQMGNPSHTERNWPEGLLDPNGGGLDAVVVSVGYRLNVFGFLAGGDLKGNLGFWDQRCALEWVQKYIPFFGGDKDRVTLGGHSAGAYSTHAQLQYELLHTDGRRPLFHNVWLCSNAIPAQPKTLDEAATQLENVLEEFDISDALPFEERIDRLRDIPASDLIDSFARLRLHTFRAVTDHDFIHADMVDKFRDGSFARLFKQRRLRLVVGETENEQWLYSKVLPPDSLADLPRALENYYAAAVCQRLLSLPQYQPRTDSDNVVESERLYGLITSDAQVRAPIRALCHQLITMGRVPAKDIFRYRIAFRPRCLDKFYPPEAGVTHGGDMYTWWLPRHTGIDDGEAHQITRWLKGSIVSLVRGEPFSWTCQTEDQYVRFDADGSIDVVKDQYSDSLRRVARVLLETDQQESN